jgi:hypothetical protein
MPKTTRQRAPSATSEAAAGFSVTTPAGENTLEQRKRLDVGFQLAYA